MTTAQILIHRQAHIQPCYLVQDLQDHGTVVAFRAPAQRRDLPYLYETRTLGAQAARDSPIF